MITKEALVKNYGYDRKSYKYIPAGAEILKYIGQIVVLVNYKKENGIWSSTFEKAAIESIDNFDNITMTYSCKYKVEGSDELKEIRIIPEGFSFGNPEETGEMKRFIPYSLHCQMVEDEVFYSRVASLYEDRKTLPIEALQMISDSKKQDEILKYSRNIGAAIKTDSGVVWVRLHKLSLHHKSGSKYYLNIGDPKNDWNIVISKEDDEYILHDLGTMKILELS